MPATNVFQNTDLITNEFLFQLVNACRFFPALNKDYADRFTDRMRVGESIKVRKPPIYGVRTGETFTEQDIEDQYCTMTVLDTKGVDLEVTNREQMFNFTSLQEQVIKPAATALANEVERDLLSRAVLATFNFVGVPGTTPSTLETYNNARAIMFDNSAPEDEMTRLIITSGMGVKTNTAGLSLFHPGPIIADSFRKGFIGRHSMAEVFESQVLPTLTTGAYGASTPAAHTGTLTGATITTDGWEADASAVAAGDVVQFANSYEVNRWTKGSTGRLKNFVITAAADDTAGAMSLSISPAIVATGNYQNVTAAPVDGDLISIYSKAAANLGDIDGLASPNGLRFHRNAFLAASFDQPMPDGGAVGMMKSDPKSGIKIRFTKAWDIDANKQKYRFDVVYAWGVAYPELACRIVG